MLSSHAVRAWVFTLNNWTPEEYSTIKGWEVSKAVVGQEVGENGTPHLQGFIRFRRTYRLAALKKLLPRAHWEPARTQDAGNYCMKEHFEQWGEVTQGTRSDLKTACDALKQGGLKRVREEHPDVYVKYHRGFAALDAPLLERRRFKTEVIWLWGPTGCGKTKKAWELCPDAYLAFSSKWWDNYKGEDVIIDDFRESWCTLDFLLRLFDRYPLTLEVKGGTVEFCSKRIVVTAPRPPGEYFNNIPEDIQQLRRRIDSIQRMEAEDG